MKNLNVEVMRGGVLKGRGVSELNRLAEKGDIRFSEAKDSLGIDLSRMYVIIPWRWTKNAGFMNRLGKHIRETIEKWEDFNILDAAELGVNDDSDQKIQ